MYVQCTLHCLSWLSVQYNNKNPTFWIFIQLRLARFDLYCIFTVTDSCQKNKTKKNNTGVGGNGSHSYWIGTGRDFFCGSGTGEV